MTTRGRRRAASKKAPIHHTLGPWAPPRAPSRQASPWAVMREEIICLREQLEGAKKLLEQRHHRIERLESELAHAGRELRTMNLELILTRAARVEGRGDPPQDE